jgi:hypothetical protein
VLGIINRAEHVPGGGNVLVTDEPIAAVADLPHDRIGASIKVHGQSRVRVVAGGINVVLKVDYALNVDIGVGDRFFLAGIISLMGSPSGPEIHVCPLLKVLK